MIMGLYENLSSSRVPQYASRISQKHACYKYAYGQNGNGKRPPQKLILDARVLLPPEQTDVVTIP